MSEQEKDRLPYDEGAEAYNQRKHYSINPYAESDWKHDEWHLGWSQQGECGGDSWDWATDDFKKE